VPLTWRRLAAAAPSAAAVGRRTTFLAAVAGALYLALLLAVDHVSSRQEQYALGLLTWLVLLAALRPLSGPRRAQALGVVVFATIGEVTGSLIWGVYSYRLDNLPLFIPPAHGLVFLTGLSLALALRAHTRALVVVAGAAAATWGLLGLTVLPRLDVAGAFGVPILIVFLLRSRNRAVYAAVFLVVAGLELYGTALGTWRWHAELPGVGIPDGNPPSGAASGYVWFDVMALLVAPYVLRAGTVLRRARRVVAGERHGLAPRAPLVELAQHERHEITAAAALALPHHPLEGAGVPHEPGERVVVLHRSHAV
jgi:hypothetical protein